MFRGDMSLLEEFVEDLALKVRGQNLAKMIFESCDCVGAKDS